MVGARQSADAAKAQASDALTKARPRARPRAERLAAGPGGRPGAAARARERGGQRVDGRTDAVPRQAGRRRHQRRTAVSFAATSRPIDTVEKGLKAAKAAGVPVDLEGDTPAAFGARGDDHRLRAGRRVRPRSRCRRPKKVPAVSPLGRAGAKKAAPRRRRQGRRTPSRCPVKQVVLDRLPRRGRWAGPAGGGRAAAAAGPADGVRAGGGPGLHAVTGKVKATGSGEACPPAGRGEGQGGPGRGAAAGG